MADGEYDWRGEEEEEEEEEGESLLLPVCAVVPVIVGMKSSFVERPPFYFPCRSAF